MPVGNNFQHAPYSRADPGERVISPEFQAGPSPDSPAGQDALAAIGKRMAGAGVRLVLFVHGTHLGTDLFGVQRLDEVGGLKRGYSRGISGLEALLALMREESNGIGKLPGDRNPPLADDAPTKALLDEYAKDAANFSTSYVELFGRALNRDLSRPIACFRHLWSSEHHHLGRAVAAVTLLHRLRRLCEEQNAGPGDRVLIQAHGHAGLVVALTSNLLAPGESPVKHAVLNRLATYAEQTGDAELRNRIQSVESPLAVESTLKGTALDVVTYGTPVRYGWDPAGVGKLLHAVNHRPMRPDGKRWLAKMELPQITMEMPIAWGGDYVQQLAVAGCDAVPATEAAKAANKALWELLEPYDGFERWLECARRCVRCQTDGLTLLVDYQDSTGSTNVRDHLFGHAAYTRLNTMLFNTSEIVNRLYTS
jgi:hypothetical protein